MVFTTVILDYRATKSLDKNSKEKRYEQTYRHPLSPSIRFSQKYPKRAKNPELSRALKRQRRENGNKDAVYYMRAYQAIKLIGDSLQIPRSIIMEAINIYRCVKDKDNDFFKKYKAKPSYLAFIKIACQIHDYPLSNIDLMGYINYKEKKQKSAAYMGKRFNRAYTNAKKILGLLLRPAKHPKYIDYVCTKLGLPFKCRTLIHKEFFRLRRYLKPQFKNEGYILALYYLKFKDRYKFTLNKLEEVFGVSRITISSRRDELLSYI